MIIELNGKKYSTKFIPMRLYREAVHIVKENDLNDLDTEKMDMIVGFICKMFDNQFTMDEFYDGYASEDFEEFFVEALTYATTSKKNKVHLTK